MEYVGAHTTRWTSSASAIWIAWKSSKRVLASLTGPMAGRDWRHFTALMYSAFLLSERVLLKVAGISQTYIRKKRQWYTHHSCRLESFPQAFPPAAAVRATVAKKSIQAATNVERMIANMFGNCKCQRSLRSFANTASVLSTVGFTTAP